MKIAHILSQVELTGAEVYAMTLAQAQSSSNQVWVISNSLHLNYNFKFTLIKQPIHTSSLWQRWKNIFVLLQLLEKEKIDILHTHSRAAVRVTFWAQKIHAGKNFLKKLFTGCTVHRTAHVCSMHGQQHFSWSKKFFDLYGDRLIFICKNAQINTTHRLKINPRKSCIVANPIDTDLWSPKVAVIKEALDESIAAQLPIRWAMIGRSTGPKGDLHLQFVIKVILPLVGQYQNLQVDLIGYELDWFKKLKTQTPDFATFSKQISFFGPLGNIDHVIHNYDLVLGSGRVAAESILCERPTFALGEYSILGLITGENLTEAMDSNFGDIGPTTDPGQILNGNEVFWQQKLTNALNYAPSTAILNDLRKKVAAQFDLNTVHKQIERIYQGALFEKYTNGYLPILMYHKIPDQDLNSKHRTFVNKNNFAKHLDFFSKHLFTTLAFKDLKLFLTGQKNWNEFPAKPLLLTFDDGYQDNLLNAAPLLKQHNMTACVFLLANAHFKSNMWDTIENPEEPESLLMTPEQRQQWVQMGFEVGSHGFMHKKITDMNAAELWEEISQSKAVLENELKTEVCVYAYTYGLFTDEAQKLVQQAGYTYGVNTDRGGLHLEENPYGIFRVSIFPEETPWSLWKKTSPWYRRYYLFKRGH